MIRLLFIFCGFLTLLSSSVRAEETAQTQDSFLKATELTQEDISRVKEVITDYKNNQKAKNDSSQSQETHQPPTALTD